MTSSAGVGIRASGWGWRYATRASFGARELSFQIRPGERVLLLGASGAGKSTVLQALAGVLGGPDEGEQHGELLIDGRPAAEARGSVGLVLQDPDSQVVLARVGDDVAFGCENLGVPREEIWHRVDAALDAVGLDLPRSHPTSMLSGGQKQRLALAGALAMRPRLLLLDEPTANLDPQAVLEVRDAVARTLQATGATLVVVEHRVAVWRDLIDRVIILDAAGGVLADGAPETVLAAHSDQLAAAGVWAGFSPRVPERASARPSVTPLLSATGVDIGRSVFGQRLPVTVNRDIDLAVAAGDAVVVTGANGSGKSTLALTIAGLIPPIGGDLAAQPALDRGAGLRPISWRSRDLLTRIGVVFQDPEHQFLASNVREELAIGPRALKLTADEVNARVDELLQRLRLDHLAAANPFTLSGGEKRRLSVATALATRPQILVLDEPMFGQDARTWQELVDLLAELIDSGTAMVAVSHDPDLARVLTADELHLTTQAVISA
ncbi:ATP-binding cassette domain-containing protein [Parafrigoribacterium mesophilum]|uniref:ABC transporter ATP-binding protein n=1 Tax=Parafrigoribacterium mesophilum TaxID=433646 RepID=UPI0031FC2341